MLFAPTATGLRHLLFDAAIDLNVPLITNSRLASAFISAFCTMTLDDINIRSWQEY